MDVRLEAISVSVMDPANLHELILLSVNGLTLKYGAALGAGGDSLLALTARQIQLDDLAMFTPYPTILGHDPTKEPFLELLYTQVQIPTPYTLHPTP